MRIPGRWKEGFVLDFHAVSSEFIGLNEYGHPEFETIGTELGELLYRLKNKSDTSVVAEIAETAAEFVRQWSPGADLVVPVPATRLRVFQPCLELGASIAEQLGKTFDDESLRRVKDVPELKNVREYGKRVQLLDGIYGVEPAAIRGRRILLIDDLYRSGATMNAAASALYDAGEAAEVFAFAITRTRSAS